MKMDVSWYAQAYVLSINSEQGIVYCTVDTFAVSLGVSDAGDF